MAKLLAAQEYVQGILTGNRVLLARAITLVESTRPEHQSLAEEILALLPAAAPSVRIAITGAPGAGKSTFIEALGMWLMEQGNKVAVLAVDPSSAITKGSILGDKTRMERLSVAPNAFIRPSPAGDSLGGVARKTRETMILAEAAGYNIVLVETVGVGQSEIAARSMCDLFLLLLLPGAGDELQGIKRGIVEMADILVVNKADGDRLQPARQAQAHYRNAIHLLPPHAAGWTPKVLVASALEQNGIPEIWQEVLDYRATADQSGFWQENRTTQLKHWFNESVTEGLKTRFFGNEQVKLALNETEHAVLTGAVSPFAAARQLLEAFWKI